MRLIDADELKKDNETNLILSRDAIRTGKQLKLCAEMFIAKIDKAPTIDAVPVVRCKNCIHWKSENGIIGYCRNMKFGHFSKWIEIDICKKTKFDFFCAAGERPDIKEILKGLKDV